MVEETDNKIYYRLTLTSEEAAVWKDLIIRIEEEAIDKSKSIVKEGSFSEVSFKTNVSRLYLMNLTSLKKRLFKLCV
jgi:hypothetical protein